MPDDRDHLLDGAFDTGHGKYTSRYREGQALKATLEGVFAPVNRLSGSQSTTASSGGSGSEASPAIGLLLLVVFAVAGLAFVGFIKGNNSEKAENFTQAQEPPPRPPVYEPRPFSSTPVLIGPEGVQLRIQPDFAARLSKCGQCPSGPLLADTTVMMNGERDGWVHLVAADYLNVDGWAPPGSDIRAVPPKQPEAAPPE